MGIGWPQLLVIAVLVLVLFGRGRISEMMGDFGKGVSSFKKGLNDPDMSSKSATPPAAQIEGSAKDAPAKSETAENASSESSSN